jgi:hypothetical protein
MEGARASTQAWEDGEVLIGWVGGGGGRGVRERVAPWGTRSIGRAWHAASTGGCGMSSVYGRARGQGGTTG